MDDTTIIIIGVAVFCLFFMVSCCKAYAQRKSSETETSATVTTVTSRVRRHPNQQEDIYNISSRVQGQGQWPTHDAHVSLDNFAITNELNKYNDDPPTYEEAMSIATSINNNTVVPAVVPKTTITPTSTTATSTSN
jgi:hypothetical protein